LRLCESFYTVSTGGDIKHNSLYFKEDFYILKIMGMEIKEFRPSSELSPYVELFWTGSFNINSAGLLQQRVVPYGYVELIIHLSDDHCELLQGAGHSPSPDYTLIGLFTKHYDVHFRRLVKVFGIRFKPEGIYHTFGTPASEVHQSFVDMENIAGRKFSEVCSKLRETSSATQMISLAEEYLLKNISSSRINLYYLNRAAEIIRQRKGNISITELSGKVYISTRQLEREFRQKLGISPKSYMRIARLNEVNRKIQNGERVDLTSISYAAGYSDQAHFIRDFRQFTGESPKVFISKKEKFIVHPNTADRLEF
jgi:AraC-like DNA-binding protein